jgi:SAM-dependent methyltransferase
VHGRAFDAVLDNKIQRNRDPSQSLRREIDVLRQELAARENEVAALKKWLAEREKWLAEREVSVLGQKVALQYDVSGFIDPEDHMLRHFLETSSIEKGVRFYFDGGNADAKKIIELMKLFGMHEEKCRILEFASGYGRITRHLTKCCDVTVSDIHPAAVEMIKSRLKTPAYVSSHAPDELSIPGKYDFVFAISLFSHLPDATFGPWIAALLSLTKPGGYLMFTTHGPKGVKASPGLPSLGPDGIGFIPLSEQADLDGQLYGTTTVAPEYVRRKIVSVGGELVSYDEIEWWDLQDQWVVRKPLVNIV